MLDIFYNYAVQAHVSARNGIICPPLFCFADYVECRLVVFDSKMARMDLSHVVSWGGAIDVDENSGTDPLVRLLPGLFNASGAANGEILFPIDCNTAEFLSRILKKTTGSLEIYGYDSSDKRVIRVKIPVDLGLPNDLPGDHEPGKVPPSAVRTLNGLPGNVEIVDADGNALSGENGKIKLPRIEPGGGDISALIERVDDAETAIDALGQVVAAKADKTEATTTAAGLMSAVDKEKLDGIDPNGINPYTIIANPVAEIPVLDNSYGVCRYLDATFTRLHFAYNVNGLRRVRLQIVSANPAITGNIVLVPVVNGISRESVVIPVGATLAKVAFPLAVDFGALELRRDMTDQRDTLKDVSPVTAIVTDVAFEVLSSWE